MMGTPYPEPITAIASGTPALTRIAARLAASDATPVTAAAPKVRPTYLAPFPSDLKNLDKAIPPLVCYSIPHSACDVNHQMPRAFIKLTKRGAV